MSIIVVTGTPGTGKTTFSQIISSKLGIQLISINDIIFTTKSFILEYDSERDSYVVDIDKLGRYIIEHYSDEKYVVEGHISHLVVDKSILEICIVLRCSPYELYRRLEKRNFSKEKIIENVQAEILDIIYLEAIERYGDDNVIQIDTTRGVKEKAEAFINAYKRGELKSEIIDWLTLIYKRGDFNRFFRQLTSCEK